MAGSQSTKGIGRRRGGREKTAYAEVGAVWWLGQVVERVVAMARRAPSKWAKSGTVPFKTTWGSSVSTEWWYEWGLERT